MSKRIMLPAEMWKDILFYITDPIHLVPLFLVDSMIHEEARRRQEETYRDLVLCGPSPIHLHLQTCGKAASWVQRLTIQSRSDSGIVSVSTVRTTLLALRNLKRLTLEEVETSDIFTQPTDFRFHLEELDYHIRRAGRLDWVVPDFVVTQPSLDALTFRSTDGRWAALVTLEHLSKQSAWASMGVQKCRLWGSFIGLEESLEAGKVIFAHANRPVGMELEFLFDPEPDDEEDTDSLLGFRVWQSASGEVCCTSIPHTIE